MSNWLNTSTSYLRGVSEVFLETLWPTSCVGCNKPGVLLCESCTKRLPYIDSWSACPVCGASYGATLCCDCNPVVLERLGVERLPYTTCISATLFEGDAARLITQYKDRGERRLAASLAHIMNAYIPPQEQSTTLVCPHTPTQDPPKSSREQTSKLTTHGQSRMMVRPFRIPPTVMTSIPATEAALQKRGFDHMELLASYLAGYSGIPHARVFNRPKSHDQRTLTRAQRLNNMKGRFSICSGAPLSRSMLLIDDVYTTGATLIAACQALSAHGVEQIHCLTFARVF